MERNKYFSGYNLKNSGRKQKFGYAYCAIWTGIVTLSPVAHITADLRTLVSDLFHVDSALVESESMKRKTRLLE